MRIPKVLPHLFFVKMPYAVIIESGAVVRRSAIGNRKESKEVIENNQPSPHAKNELTKEKMPVKRKSIPKAVDCFGAASKTVFIEALPFLRTAKGSVVVCDTDMIPCCGKTRTMVFYSVLLDSYIPPHSVHNIGA